ncbi:hypothetical protein ABPG75_009609 [Micractinium tetrahymenae]
MRLLGRARDMHSGSSSPALGLGGVAMPAVNNASMASAEVTAAAAPAAAAAAAATTAEPAAPSGMGLEEQRSDGPEQEEQHQGQEQLQPLVKLEPASEEVGQEQAEEDGEQRAPPACALCSLGKEAEGALGRLLLFDCSAKTGKARWERVHLLCAAWSPRAHAAGAEEPGAQHGLMMVPEEVRRAHSLKCCCCKQRGAGMGCDVAACRRTYHLPCAMLEKHSRFVSDSWQLYCPHHASTVDEEAEADDMREQRAALRRLLHRQQGQGTLSPAAEAVLQAAIEAKKKRKAAREQQRQAKQQQQQQGTAGKRPAGGQAATPQRPAKRLHATSGNAQLAAQGGAAAAAAAAAEPAGLASADREGERQQQQHKQQRQRKRLQQRQAHEKQGREGAPRQRSAGSSQPADTGCPQLAAPAPAAVQGNSEAGHVAAPGADAAAGDADERGEQRLQLPGAQECEQRAEDKEEAEEQEEAGQAEQQRQRQHVQGGDPAEGQPAEPAAAAQQQAGGAALQLLPPAAVALLRDVYGAVSPGTVPLAAEYLYSEGVRSFSDVGYVDPEDFFTNVPTSKMLLNKLFILHRQRDAAGAE